MAVSTVTSLSSITGNTAKQEHSDIDMSVRSTEGCRVVASDTIDLRVLCKALQSSGVRGMHLLRMSLIAALFRFPYRQ